MTRTACTFHFTGITELSPAAGASESSDSESRRGGHRDFCDYRRPRRVVVTSHACQCLLLSSLSCTVTTVTVAAPTLSDSEAAAVTGTVVSHWHRAVTVTVTDCLGACGLRRWCGRNILRVSAHCPGRGDSAGPGHCRAVSESRLCRAAAIIGVTVTSSRNSLPVGRGPPCASCRLSEPQ